MWLSCATGRIHNQSCRKWFLQALRHRHVHSARLSRQTSQITLSPCAFLTHAWTKSYHHRVIIRALSFALAGYPEADLMLRRCPSASYARSARGDTFVWDAFLVGPSQHDEVAPATVGACYPEIQFVCQTPIRPGADTCHWGCQQCVADGSLDHSCRSLDLQGHRWKQVFRQTGVWTDSFSVSGKIKRGRQFEQLPQLVDDRLTAEVVRQGWPRNCVF